MPTKRRKVDRLAWKFVKGKDGKVELLTWKFAKGKGGKGGKVLRFPEKDVLHRTHRDFTAPELEAIQAKVERWVWSARG